LSPVRTGQPVAIRVLRGARLEELSVVAAEPPPA
jgi:hypothetical protein